MRKTVMVSYDPARGYFVNLPTYTMIEKTFRPIVAGLIHAAGVYPDADSGLVMGLEPFVDVEIPDEYVDDNGKISAEIIQKMYGPVPSEDSMTKGHPVFSKADYEPPKEKK